MSDILKTFYAMYSGTTEEKVANYDPQNNIHINGIEDKKKLPQVLKSLNELEQVAQSIDQLLVQSTEGISTDTQMVSFLKEAVNTVNQAREKYFAAPEFDCVSHAAHEMYAKCIIILRKLVESPVLSLEHSDDFNDFYDATNQFSYLISANTSKDMWDGCRFQFAIQELLLFESIKNSKNSVASEHFGYWGNGAREETYYKFLGITISPTDSLHYIARLLKRNDENRIIQNMLDERIVALYKEQEVLA